jgi:hypothetical protein
MAASSFSYSPGRLALPPANSLGLLAWLLLISLGDFSCVAANLLASFGCMASQNYLTEAFRPTKAF